MSMQRWAVLGPIGALSSPMALKERSSDMAQRIEEPKSYEDQQEYAAFLERNLTSLTAGAKGRNRLQRNPFERWKFLEQGP
jgi:hypothetical protein